MSTNTRTVCRKWGELRKVALKRFILSCPMLIPWMSPRECFFPHWTTCIDLDWCNQPSYCWLCHKQKDVVCTTSTSVLFNACLLKRYALDSKPDTDKVSDRLISHLICIVYSSPHKPWLDPWLKHTYLSSYDFTLTPVRLSDFRSHDGSAGQTSRVEPFQLGIDATWMDCMQTWHLWCSRQLWRGQAGTLEKLQYLRCMWATKKI